MIGEHWKAVYCRRECVEQNWILFSCDSAPYTAVFRDVRTVTESVHYFHLVCLSDRKYQRDSHWPELGKICLRVFMKICRGKFKID
jgi:hypothetical protein